MSRFVCAVLLSLLTGCAIVPEPLKVPDDQALLDYEKVFKQDDIQPGQKARWGGVIASVKNQKQGGLIEVMQLPLSANSRPNSAQTSLGRFWLKIDGLADPLIYKKGKQITAVGEYAGVEPGKIGELDYLFPVLKAEQTYMWKEIVDPVYIIERPIWVHPMHYHRYPYFRYQYWPQRPRLNNNSSSEQNDKNSTGNATTKPKDVIN